MGKIPSELKQTIAHNIRQCRLNKFPGRGGGKKCAEAFGVSPQQWSPWERGMRTPDELRLSQIADFFGVTVEMLRRKPEQPAHQPESVRLYEQYGLQAAPALREAGAPPYGLPPLRRDPLPGGGITMADFAMASARLMSMVGSTTRGVVDGRLDIGNAIIVLQRLGDLLEQRLREADAQAASQPLH